MMRAVVVGLGGRARAWVDSCRNSPEVELVACVEPVPEQRARKIEQYQLDPRTVFATLGEALAAGPADFVVDVTPPKAHEAVALEAFAAGLHVLGEKPLSDDFAAAKRIVAASQAAGLTHMVTQNYRFAPVPRTARRLLAEQAVGAPGSCHVEFWMPWADSPGSHYCTQPFMLITDMGIHHFDLLRYVLAAEPERVLCTTWNLPWGWHAGDAAHVFHAVFTGGLRVTHCAVGCSVGKRSSWNGEWHVDGPAGSLTIEDNHIFVTHSHRTPTPKREEIPLDDVPSGTDGVLAEFVAAIAEGREPECSGADNLKSLATVFAGIKSATENRWVEIAEITA